MVELFYLHSNATLTNLDVRVGPPLTRVRDLTGTQVTDSYADFGQATFPIFERTNLTVGGRYIYDARRTFGRLNGAPFPSQEKN